MMASMLVAGPERLNNVNLTDDPKNAITYGLSLIIKPFGSGAIAWQTTVRYGHLTRPMGASSRGSRVLLPDSTNKSVRTQSASLFVMASKPRQGDKTMGLLGHHTCELGSAKIPRRARIADRYCED